ncbi:MAG: type II secretion system inner membrane protein GspF [Deltaproteobacteria bacterium]|nr:type II secretion system inner membrane protein GspF [Deltaproteobacteria bacterium]
MPTYEYKGLNARGKAIRGVIDADSPRMARSKLRGDSIFPTEITEDKQRANAAAAATAKQGKRGARKTLLVARSIPPLELALATRQLSTLIGAAVPLVESLTALTEQIEHTRLKGIMAHARDRVNEGANFADALEESRSFPTLYVSLIRAGEASGALEHVLSRLAEYLESQVRLRNKIGSIMIYPLVMLGVAMAVVGILVTFVLPQITGLLESMNLELPMITRFIIGLSNVARDWWIVILALGTALVFAYRAYIRTETGKHQLDQVMLRLPIFGKLTRLIAISRFTSTLSTLLAGGVPIVAALGIAKRVCNNEVIADAISDAQDAITEGASLARPLKTSGHFPPTVIHMIDVGERSGELESMLEKIAETFDEQIETAVTRLSALMEPLLILLMVGIVAGIIMATLLPLTQLTRGLGG